MCLTLLCTCRLIPLLKLIKPGVFTEMSNLAKTVIKSGYSEASGIEEEKIQFNEMHRSSSWVEDSAVTNCAACNKAFNITRRRHHCRECGEIFCSPCSIYKVVVGGRIKRVRSMHLIFITPLIFHLAPFIVMPFLLQKGYRTKSNTSKAKCK